MKRCTSSRRRRAADAPVKLIGATAFADEALSGEDVIRLLKRFPQFGNLLRDEVARDDRLADGAKPIGRPILPGQWELAYLAYVTSGQHDVQPWWRTTSRTFWRQCGFADRPPYHRVWEWFGKRLEAKADAFAAVAIALIQHARKATDGKVGRYLHVDGTEAETQARLVHVCPKGSACYSGKSAAALSHEPVSAVRKERHALDDESEEEVPDQLLGRDGRKTWVEDGVLYAQVGKAGCIYRVTDPTAGVRAYTGDGRASRFWVGFYNTKAVDHYTGAPVAVHLTSASVPEFKSYPDVFKRVLDALGGEAPHAVVADRGYGFTAVFEHNTKHGTATITPWRKRGARDHSDEDRDGWDRHGVPRCKHCGGETQFVRFHPGKGNPRVWFRCTGKPLPACEKDQSLTCERDWKLLLPLWSTTARYQALLGAHSEYEGAHHYWRSRYRVGADNALMRPKRRGISCQQLRANAALLVEWLRIVVREGWLGKSKTSGSKEVGRDGQERLNNLHAARRAAGLTTPYGPAAVSLGTGPERPEKPKPDVDP